MDKEILLSHLVGLRLLFVALIGWIYSRAGRGWSWPILGKVRRKVYLPIIAAMGLILIMLIKGEQSIWLLGTILLTVPVYYVVMSIFSYGADSFLRPLGKVLQRIIVHGAVGACPILIVLVTRCWEVYVIGIVISAFVGAILGTRNPIEAPEEEGIIGFTEFAYTMFLI